MVERQTGGEGGDKDMLVKISKIQRHKVAAIHKYNLLNHA